MEGIVKLLGIVMVVVGVINFLKPNLVKKCVDFLVKEKWIYVGAILCFIIGIIFLSAASQCAIPWIVLLLGVISLAKGVAIFVLGQNKIKSILDSLLKKPANTLRGFALIKIAVGVIIIYAA
jgi:uncharacterized protein YjeT (DUF2065 family)